MALRNIVREGETPEPAGAANGGARTRRRFQLHFARWAQDYERGLVSAVPHRGRRSLEFVGAPLERPSRPFGALQDEVNGCWGSR